MSQHHGPDKANRVFAPVARPEPARRALGLGVASGLRFCRLGDGGLDRIGGLLLALLVALAGASKQLVHATGHSFRAVDGEREVGHVADAHAVPERGADEGARRHQALERGLLFRLAAVNGDEDSRTLTSGRQYHVGNVTLGDARVGQLTFEHRPDLVGERTGDAVAVIGSGSLFWHGSTLHRTLKDTKVWLLHGDARGALRRSNGLFNGLPEVFIRPASP